MDSASLQFVLFGLIAAAVSNLSSARVWRSTVLLIASLAFLAMQTDRLAALLPMAGFLLFGYSALSIRKRSGGRGAGWSIPAAILAYAWLKKYTFFPEQVLLRSPYITLGLSYIFFRVLHLLIEAGEEKAQLGEKQNIGFFSYLLYTLNFTTLVSGPIQNYDEFARDQFAMRPLPLGAGVIGLQVERIVRGFFKVNVVAMLLYRVHENALEHLVRPIATEHTWFAACALIVVYPLFLYANFSGYIDMVIALARLMRIQLPENFNRPFSASSFLDFWNRWHITLSKWLKTYVYNPLLVLMLRRDFPPSVEPFLGVACFFVTFFLIGIWHGRTSEYVMFGILQGAGVACNKLWQIFLTRILGRKGYKDLARNNLYVAFGRGLTFTWFAFTMCYFWANWQQIGRVFSAITASSWFAVWLAIWCGATATLAIWELLRELLLNVRVAKAPALNSRYALVVYATTMGLIAIVVSFVLNQPAPGIVYKAF